MQGSPSPCPMYARPLLMVYFYSRKHLFLVLCSLIHSSNTPSPKPGARNSASKQNTPAHQPAPWWGLPSGAELSLGCRSGRLSRLEVRDFPAGCYLGSASCAHSGLGVRWPRPSRASPLGLVGECPAACSRCVYVCACTHQPQLAPHSPPHLCVEERGGCRAWSHPQASLFSFPTTL